jgi:hypothetical protein
MVYTFPHLGERTQMPWNECKPMDERLRFVARLLEGEKMAPLCRKFGISRVTGYKIFDRYKECGLDALHDRSKAPFSVFERTFRDFGLPAAIRTDNGVPFAAPWAMFGLSRLAVWWLRLGIRLQRIKPGQPQHNGRHERMHLTLKNETTKPAAFNFLQQQERVEDFIRVYNQERPHQALGGLYPAEIYTPSARHYEPPQDPDYPFHDRTVRVTRCERICLGSRKINLSTSLAEQLVGIREVDDQV